MAKLTIEFDARIDALLSAFTKITTSVDSLSRRIEQQNATLAKGFATAATSAKTAEKNFSHALESIDRGASKAAGTLKAIGVAAAGMAAGGGFVSLARGASDFATQLANVNTLLNSSNPSIDKFCDSVLKLDSVKDSTDLMRGLYQALSSGVPATLGAGGAIELLDAAQKAATAGLSSTEDAVLALTRVFNTYGPSAGTAAQVSDKLFQVVKDGVIEFPQLAKGIGEAAGVASKFGVDFNQLAAMIAQGSRVVDKAEVFTQVRNTIVQLAAATPEAVTKAGKLGVELGEAAVKAKGVGGVLADIIEKTGGSKEAIRQLLPEVSSFPLIFTLAAEHGSAFAKQLVSIENASGTTADALAKMAETPAAAFAKLQKAIGDKAIEVLTELQSQFSSTAKTLAEFVKEFDAKEIAQEIKHIADAFILVAKSLDFVVGGAYRAARALKEAIEGASEALSPGSRKGTFDKFGRAVAPSGSSLGAAIGAGADANLQRNLAALNALEAAEEAASKKAAEEKKAKAKARAAENALKAKAERALKEPAAEQSHVDPLFDLMENAKFGSDLDRIAEELRTAREKISREIQADQEKENLAREERAKQRRQRELDETMVSISLAERLIAGDFVGTISSALEIVQTKAMAAGESMVAFGASIGQAFVGALQMGAHALGQFVLGAGSVESPGTDAAALVRMQSRSRQRGAFGVAAESQLDQIEVFFDRLEHGAEVFTVALVNRLPHLIEGFARAASAFIEAIVSNMDQIFAAIVAKLPSLFTAIAAQIPQLLGLWINAQIGMLPELAAAMVTAFVDAFFNTDFLDRLVRGLVEGLGRGLEKLNPLSKSNIGRLANAGATLGLSELPGVGDWFSWDVGGVVGRARTALESFDAGGIVSGQNAMISSLRDRATGMAGKMAIVHPGERVLTAQSNARMEAMLERAVGAGTAPVSVGLQVEGAGLDRLVGELVARALKVHINRGTPKIRDATDLARDEFPNFPNTFAALGY